MSSLVGFTENDKLHKTKGILTSNKTKSKCGMAKLVDIYPDYDIYYEDYDYCKRCFDDPWGEVTPKSRPVSELVNKGFSEWCGRVGIKL